MIAKTGYNKAIYTKSLHLLYKCYTQQHKDIQKDIHVYTINIMQMEV